MTALAPTLQAFFTDRLIRQRQASPHTLAAYRDTLRLLLVFASARHAMEPSKLDVGAPKTDQLGCSQTCLSRERKQGTIAPPSRG